MLPTLMTESKIPLFQTVRNVLSIELVRNCDSVVQYLARNESVSFGFMSVIETPLKRKKDTAEVTEKKALHRSREL